MLKNGEKDGEPTFVTDNKTIQLHVETYDVLCRLGNEIQEIFGGTVSFDKVIRFLIMVEDRLD